VFWVAFDNELNKMSTQHAGHERVDELRLMGNEAFKCEEWNDAIASYTEALQVLESSPDYSGSSSQVRVT
jgi:hypothetical protein